jgi:hypothetical protein
MRVQEIFTEFKKIKRRLDTNVANTAPFREIFPYDEGKCPKNWKKLSPVKDVSALVGPITPIVVL